MSQRWDMKNVEMNWMRIRNAIVKANKTIEDDGFNEGEPQNIHALIRRVLMELDEYKYLSKKKRS